MARQSRKTREKAEDPQQEQADLSSELDALRAERDDLHERWQRAAADYQNLRRRGLAESEERLRHAMQPLLDKMLIVLDYLDMALACPTTTEESKNLAVGVRLTRDQFLRALEQEDVRPIPPSETFDPSTQEAKGAVERDDVPPGTVLETVRAGYTWRGEVLRYAQVIVAKAPAGAAQGETAADARGADEGTEAPEA